MEYASEPLRTVFDVAAIVNIAYYKLPSNYIFAGERHKFWEFIYVDRGNLIVTAGAKKYLLNAGELAFHCPDEFHAFQALGASNVVVVSFFCGSEAMHRFERKVLPLHLPEKQSLQALVAEASLLYQYFENDPPQINLQKNKNAPWGSDQLIKNYLEQLLICICRRDDNIQVEARAISSTQVHHRLLIAQQAKDYLNSCYAEKITLASLSTALGVSTSYLKRIFREHVGQSVMEYLSALRIGEAKRLVRQGDLNFTQIAQQVGYDSIYYFSFIFKKRTGMSLTEYAKSLKG